MLFNRIEDFKKSTIERISTVVKDQNIIHTDKYDKI